ncbi:amidohydrolase [Hyphomicrobium sp.]|uniref:amidohydrolase n=1 Tax=Hyphomicrobium sp. TaxID=82 RepID=UPI002BB119D9|nr:amidohydrolase family protein [Hyphomicrobium sp.]HVZ05232.1 amidohydrolase family protein [Hyphomicrobium sp.]
MTSQKDETERQLDSTQAPDQGSDKSSSAMSRRQLLAGAAVGSIAASTMMFSSIDDANADFKHFDFRNLRRDRRCKKSNDVSSDLGFVNGKFLDGQNKVFSSMAIKDGRIATIGSTKGLSPGSRIIDLKGHTVIPGLINMHVHHSRTGMTPDYEMRDIETAFSIREIQHLLARRAKGVPPGRFVGCHLGWHYIQLDEKRPPTAAELDSACPRNPVFLSGRAGWVENMFSVTNTLGRKIFSAAGLSVDASGRIDSTPEAALAVLQARQTPEDKLRQTWDNNAWTLSNGVTNVLDPGVAAVTAQDYPALELWRQGMLHVRHRLNYASNDPAQVLARAQNIFRLMGDDMFRAGGFGETIGTRPVTSSTLFEPTAEAIAMVGWKLQNHTDFYADVDFQLAAFQRINEKYPLKDLRWQLIHCFQTTPAQLKALKDLGVGVDLESERYLDRLERGPGPFYRQIVDSGITIGAGTDGSNYCPNNPWLNFYYATTGINVRGIPENAKQKISRLEALKIWTGGSAYQNFDDDKGSFEVGKVADLAVLSADLLRVSDANLRNIKSAMTIVGGDIVHQGDWPDYAQIGDDFFYTGT